MDTENQRSFGTRSIASRHEQEKTTSESLSFFDGLLATGENFYRSETDRLRRMAKKMKVPQHQIEDIVSEAWMDAIRHRQNFSTEAGLRCWLGKAVRHKSLDLFRQRAWRNVMHWRFARREESRHSERVNRASHEIARERLLAIVKILRKKHPKDAWLVYAHFFRGRKLKELAKRPGCPLTRFATG